MLRECQGSLQCLKFVKFMNEFQELGSALDCDSEKSKGPNEPSRFQTYLHTSNVAHLKVD